MRRILAILYIFINTLVCSAQSISVASFKMLPNDLTANTNGTEVLDQNGDKAALIRIQTTLTGFSFDAGMLGVVKTMQKTGEIWVYVPKGSKRITLRHQHFGTCEYVYPCAIESARTYEMKLVSGSVQTIVNQDAGGNFLTMKVKPENAIVYIDDNIQQSDGKGGYSIFLDYGEHTYRIDAANYTSQKGIIEIDRTPSNIDVSLTSSLASLSITCTTENANIYVNKQLKGIGNWKGHVDSGNYLIEVTKDGYRKVTSNITVEDKEVKEVNIPALEPVCGTVKVDVKPIGSTIIIDGKEMGKTPVILKNVIIGEHVIEIKGINGNEITKKISVKENETLLINDIIPDYTADQLLEMAYNSELNRDYYKAFEYGYKSINLGSREALYFISRCYGKASGKTWEENSDSLEYAKAASMYAVQSYSEEAFDYLSKAAGKNYPPALVEMARFYLSTKRKDMQTFGVELCLKAAEQNYAVAQYELALCYLKGLGVNESIDKAIEWLKKAVKQDYAEAQNLLGNMYYQGTGVSKNFGKAAELWQRASIQGSAQAQYEYASCLLKGEGVTQDTNKGIEWLKRSASRNYVASIKLLAFFYYNGEFVEINKEKAFEYFKEAADMDDAEAQFMVAECYMYGKGTHIDKKKAKIYYMNSANNGYEAAKAMLEINFNK